MLGETGPVEPADDLDRCIADELARQAAERRAAPMADTSMFLSHHWPSRYDRCVVIGGRHVCRRCIVLYPVALAVCALAAAGVTWPTRLDPWVLWLLPLPGVIEFSLDALGVIRHHPWRQGAVSALLAIAYGKVLWRYLQHPGDALAWGVVAVDCGACFVAALVGRRFSGAAGLHGDSNWPASPDAEGSPGAGAGIDAGS